MLIERLADDRAPHVQHLIGATLVVRETTGPVPPRLVRKKAARSSA